MKRFKSNLQNYSKKRCFNFFDLIYAVEGSLDKIGEKKALKYKMRFSSVPSILLLENDSYCSENTRANIVKYVVLR